MAEPFLLELLYNELLRAHLGQVMQSEHATHVPLHYLHVAHGIAVMQTLQSGLMRPLFYLVALLVLLEPQSRICIISRNPLAPPTLAAGADVAPTLVSLG